MIFTFMMCSERSGSNLLTRLMDSHPEVCGPAPVHLLRSLADARHHFGDLSDDQQWSDFLDASVALMQTMMGRWRTSWTRQSLDALQPARSLAGVVRAVYEAEATSHGKRRVFMKTNHLHRYLPLVLSAFPDARIVHQVRDPRDMALSWKNARVLRGDVVRASRVWCQDQTQARAAFGQMDGTGRMTWHRYEDLVDDPERVLQRICAHIGITYSEQMLDFHRQGEADDYSRATSAWQNIRRPLMAGNHGKYRSALGPDEVRLIEWRARSIMTAYGYTPDHPPSTDAEGEQLLSMLTPLERHEKPGYAEVPQSERELRVARDHVLRAMSQRPVANLLS